MQNENEIYLLLTIEGNLDRAIRDLNKANLVNKEIQCGLSYIHGMVVARLNQELPEHLKVPINGKREYD